MNTDRDSISNPFRPGAGHTPPYLAGRIKEQQEVRQLFDQKIILENIVLTGLRGVGKTVLLEKLKPIATEKRWLWIGTDLSESSSLSEERISLRLITDLSTITSSIVISEQTQLELGFQGGETKYQQTLDYKALLQFFSETPGLVSDKIKAVLELVWSSLPKEHVAGVIFAYDEAQNLTDRASKDEYPLSLLLDVFQSIQRKNIPFMLFLTGLPTLFPKLVEARTFAERMFHVVFLQKLDRKDSRDAIVKPIENQKIIVEPSEETVNAIIDVTGGYPYFIQFICREIFDIWISQINLGQAPSVSMDQIIEKLDADFFSGRWARPTDRQRQLLTVIALLPDSESEFTVQEIVNKSHNILAKGFSSSHVNQMLTSLTNSGLIYKNRHGRYSFAVPLLSGFIRRQFGGASDRS